MKILPTLATWVTILVWTAMAVWLGFWPDELLSAFGVHEYPPPIRTEIRAFYGGVQLAIATLMLIYWIRRDLFTSLLIGGLPLGLSALGRIVGMAWDGFSLLHLILAILEFSGILFCFLGIRILLKTNCPAKLG
ncbi:MAG: DUF4345 family protein [Planctomycetaceae bacterium]|nr:DUF4345 family protein [Planctomycetaceae bacterium]